MLSMSRKAMILMAVFLAAATAATAATAFAGARKKLPPVSGQVSQAIHTSNDAIRNARVKVLVRVRGTESAPIRATLPR